MNWIALVAIIVSIVVLYFVGTIITYPFRTNDNDSLYDTFVSLLVGFLAVTMGYAIVKTGGNTVLIISAIIGLAYLIHARMKNPLFSMNSYSNKYVLTEAAENGVNDIYWADDSHWSPIGAKIVAEEIARRVDSLELF